VQEASTRFFSRPPPAPSVLADRAIMLLLLLVHNYRTRGESNPFREAFCSVIDEHYGERLMI
jgi:hypothetical protein